MGGRGGDHSRSEAKRAAALPAPLATLAALLGASLVLFGLDKGELAWEQAAFAVQACCPDPDLTRMTQVGGWSRSREPTAVTGEESACIRDATREDIRERRIAGLGDVTNVDSRSAATTPPTSI